MKKRLISAVIAAIMAVSSLPVVTWAADGEIKPVLSYSFDGKDALSDLNGKNKLKLSGGASITEDGNTGHALLLDGIDGYALLPKIFCRTV